MRETKLMGDFPCLPASGKVNDQHTLYPLGSPPPQKRKAESSGFRNIYTPHTFLLKNE